MTNVIELRSDEGLVLSLMDHGATWLSCRVPMGDGSLREVLLGCATPQDQIAQKAFLGATVGRYANRIAGGRLVRDGRSWQLTRSAGARHTLHGGPEGFHARRWAIVARRADEVVFALDSADGDQGFPGRLSVRVVYRVRACAVEMAVSAEVDRPCPVAITQHAYFNLDPVHADVREHRLQLRASRVMPVDVVDSGFDFRQRKRIAEDWLQDEQQRSAGGYDHAFLLDAAPAEQPAAMLWASDGSLSMSVQTDAPALQIYTGQYLAGTLRREGGAYDACTGVALEPGFLPDSPNHPEWPQPDCWLRPGQLYRQLTRWVFTPA